MPNSQALTQTVTTLYAGEQPEKLTEQDMKKTNEARVLESLPALRSSAKQLRYELEFDIPLRELWTYMCDSERIERKAGIPPFTFDWHNTADGKVSKGETKIPGMTMRFLELPFEWSEYNWHSLERVFLNGPFRYVRGFFEYKALSPERTALRITIFVKGRLPDSLALLLMKFNFHGLLKAGRQITEDIKKNRPAGDLVAQRKLDSAPEDAEKIAGLYGWVPSANEQEKIDALYQAWVNLTENKRLAYKIAEFIFTRPDNIVRRMRPYVLADALKFDRNQTLEFFLRATRSGQLDMSWDLLCPSCQGAPIQAATLNDVNNQAHCEACDIQYDAGFDENVELTFRPNASVREVDIRNFCPASPANTRHITHMFFTGTQKPDRNEFVTLQAGDYRFVEASSNRSVNFTIGDNHTDDLTNSSKTPKDLLSSKELELPPSFQLSLKAEPTIRRYKIEHRANRSDIVTAGFVTGLQEFRRLFSSEVLRPGVEIGVKNMTILFSDLKDSTKLYDSEGDAAAFKKVQDHFDIVEGVIAQNSGAVVKTIGDAVMAVFSKPEDGARAALGVLKEFQTGQLSHLDIKLGLHNGPCIALNLNDRLDYFGSTVNTAARLQNLARGGDLILSQEIWSSSAVRKAVRERKEQQGDELTMRKGKKELKGLSGEKIVYQLRFNPGVQPKPKSTVNPSQVARQIVNAG